MLISLYAIYILFIYVNDKIEIVNNDNEIGTVYLYFLVYNLHTKNTILKIKNKYNFAPNIFKISSSYKIIQNVVGIHNAPSINAKRNMASIAI